MLLGRAFFQNLINFHLYWLHSNNWDLESKFSDGKSLNQRCEITA